jgi:uncharacterized protein YdaU (DUF1376 family)
MWVGDYLKRTSRLSILEHGAYVLLLNYYYAEERPPPPDLDEVYRLVRAMLPEERRAVDKILFTYFDKRADGYHNSRADEEIATAKGAIQLMSDAGKEGAAKRWGSHKGGNGADHGVGIGVEHASSNLQPPTSILQPPTSSQLPTPADAGVAPCPHAEIIKRYAEHLPMGRQVKPPWKGERAKNLQARWRELPERQSVEWWDQLFEHCAQSKFLTGRAPPRRQGEKPFEISLDWIVNLGNFQKIIEGAYDG